MEMCPSGLQPLIIENDLGIAKSLLSIPQLPVVMIPPVVNLNPQPRINFHHFLKPLVQLILTAGRNLLKYSFATILYFQEILLDIQIVFSRLIFSSAFDAESPAFKQWLNQLENRVPVLQKSINQLKQKFQQIYLISQNLVELKNLQNEISQAKEKLQEYVNQQPPCSVQDQLVETRDAFNNLDLQINKYCRDKGSDILGHIEDMMDLFKRGGNYWSKDVPQQLMKIKEDFQEAVISRLYCCYSCDTEIEEILSRFRELSRESNLLDQTVTTYSTSTAEPLKLKNIGNSCYLDSVLECLLSMDFIRNRLCEPLLPASSRSLVDQKKLAIQQEIIKFIAYQGNEQGNQPLNQIEFILFLMAGHSLKENPSLFSLREAIFNSDFHPELKRSRLTHQHDAAYVMELLINHLLPECKLRWRGHATVSVFPGVEFVNGGKDGKDEDLVMLQVPLCDQEEGQTLQELVKKLLGKHPVFEQIPTDQRKFDPKNGMLIAGKEGEAALVQHASETTVDQFDEWYTLTKLPPVLIIQFKRFTAELKKDNRSVELPHTNGILDLGEFYDPPKGEPKGARYKIKGMVRHIGFSLEYGHCIAEVEINGKYFHCDDLSYSLFQETSQEEFFRHQDPYLLFLERIPDEEK